MLIIRSTSVFATLFPLVLTLALSVCVSTATASELPGACEAPQILLGHDTIRQARGGVGDRHCYRLDHDSAAFLHLELTDTSAVAGFAGSPNGGARLEVFEAPGSATLWRTAASRLMLAEAGAILVTVSAEDPRRPLPPYRLTSRRAELDIEPEKSETDDELEIEPGMMAPIEAPLVCGLGARSETDDELEIEPEKSETDDELEIEPGITATDPVGCQAIRPLIERICRVADDGTDDHGDSLACATPFRRRARGTLDNGWGDDTDVFRFEIETWQTVELTANGEVDTRGTLYDRHGQRLADTVEATEHGGFRIVRTLGPGTYFVRVEGDGSVGEYQLDIAPPGR